MTLAARRGTGRLWPRFSAMFRVRPGRLALTSVGLAAAAILGVQLGQSAISEINPVHFQGPLAPQAITPPPEPAPYDPYAQNYVWSANPGYSVVDCAPGCDSARTRRAVQYALDQSAGPDPSLPYWRDATPNTELQPWSPGAMPGGRTFDRYMHYPVDRAQAERPLVEQVAGVPAASAETARPPAVVAPATEQTPVAEPVVQQ